jgi:transposase
VGEFVVGKEGWTMTWAVPPMARDQLVLFPSSLDEVIPEDHLVRDLDAILRSLDWTEFEAKYHGTLGARPVHPRVLASIIIYGHLTRVRSSRQLEGALWCRLDFRWLAEGEQLDHSTISIFRKQFAELETQVAQADALDEEQLSGASLPGVSKKLAKKLRHTKNRLQAVRDAQAEIARVKAAQEPVPERIPLTDPESRISPNKEGGFAPNYTPLSAVDRESGLILDGDVIQNTDQEQHLVASLEAIESRFAAAGFQQHVEHASHDPLVARAPRRLAQPASELRGLRENNSRHGSPCLTHPGRPVTSTCRRVR